MALAVAVRSPDTRLFYSLRIVANIPPVRRSSSGAVVRPSGRMSD